LKEVKDMAGLVDIKSLFDLTGKVAIVTGAAEGMGKEICRFLASAGAKVAAADINFPWAVDTAQEINEERGHVRAYKLDVSEEPQVVEMVQAVRNDFGRLDILVNVAGVQDRELLGETSLALWDKIHHINLRGPFLTIREAAKIMRRDKSGGRIVNISSMGSLYPIFDGLVAYNASKSGLNGLTRNAAFELAKDGITVNAVLPGNTTTAGQARSPGPPIDPELIPTMIPPLGRAGKVSDIAGAVLFLVSPAAEWITGQTLVVDGGHLIK
jgi:NAD(P)-dependent dehydrogenase (short-subunit alcohol dehydrogenase family)